MAQKQIKQITTLTQKDLSIEVKEFKPSKKRGQYLTALSPPQNSNRLFY